MPPLTVTLWVGYRPQYDPGYAAAYIPEGGKQGWTFAAERLELLHELGHAFDYSALRPSNRARFRGLAQTTCKWRAKVCHVPNVPCRCGQILNVSPEEMFAEEYAAMGLGLTRAEVDAQGLPTYGWTPPAGSEPLMRALIWSVRR